jgi:hypothetical protein
MAEIFMIGQGNTTPSLIYTLYPPVSLVGATVWFTMVREGAPDTEQRKIDNQLATTEVANPGVVRYDWAQGDADTVENYEGQFDILFANGKRATYPNTEPKIKIVVNRSLRSPA